MGWGTLCDPGASCISLCWPWHPGTGDVPATWSFGQMLPNPAVLKGYTGEIQQEGKRVPFIPCLKVMPAPILFWESSR